MQKQKQKAYVEHEQRGAEDEEQDMEETCSLIISVIAQLRRDRTSERKWTLSGGEGDGKRKKEDATETNGDIEVKAILTGSFSERNKTTHHQSQYSHQQGSVLLIINSTLHLHTRNVESILSKVYTLKLYCLKTLQNK